VVSLVQLKRLEEQTRPDAERAKVAPSAWVHVGKVQDFPYNGGATIKYGKVQIAVFNFTSRGTWYACQQMCPHKKAFVLSRGILGDTNGLPKIACPLHKKTFSLDSGACLSGDAYTVQVFPVKVEGDYVYLELPPTEVLDKLLATEIGCHLATSDDTTFALTGAS
jgi:nitrite reductase (NADH) large subunit